MSSYHRPMRGLEQAIRKQTVMLVAGLMACGVLSLAVLALT